MLGGDITSGPGVETFSLLNGLSTVDNEVRDEQKLRTVLTFPESYRF